MTRSVVILLVLLLFSSSAKAHRGQRRCVVIVVPGLRADDLSRAEMPLLRKIVSRGAVGWMNTRTARVARVTRDPIDAAYLTLGAGARAAGGGETVDSVHARNLRLDHSVQIGELGDLLRAAGIPTLLEGAADDVASDRSARGMIMDSSGRIDWDRSDIRFWLADNRADPADPRPEENPFGIAQAIEPSPISERVGGVVVYVLGELSRAERYAPLCTPEMAAAYRRRALGWTDWAVNSRAYTSGGPTRFLLLAPCPADSAPDGDRLAPILMWGDGVTPGLLTSGSTHTPGLVTNTDFLPTVAHYFGIEPPKGLVGRPMTVAPLPRRTRFQNWLDRVLGRPQASAPNGPTPEFWAEMHDRWYARSRKQALFGGLPTIQALLVAASLMLAARPNLRSLSPCLLSSLSALPLALLVLPPVSPASPLGAGALLAAVLLAAAGLAWLRPKAAPGLAAGMLAALVGIVALDLLAGARLLRQAWMSYSVMEGARYYGIGNEYAGAVFGAMMALSLPLLRGKRIRRWPLVTAAWLAVCVLMGSPQLGANAGGFLGAGIGCGAAALVWGRGRIRARDALLIVAAAALAMAAFLAVDLARGGAEQSHIARAITGGGSILNIAARKAMLNGYLLVHSPWTLGLLASAYGLWRLRRETGSTDRAAGGMWAGLAAGATGLLLLNDSRIISAAECLLVAYAASSLLARANPAPVPDSPASR